MIHIGEYQTLTIKREKPQGFYLADAEGNEVLMPGTYFTDDMNIDDEIEVCVYCDSDDRQIATTEKPMLTVGQFAYLQVTEVNKMGAFCDWGILKELFIPFRNQAAKMKPDQSYVVHLYIDKLSQRLVGTTKFKGFLKQLADENIQMGQEVDLLVYNENEVGYHVIINQTYAGLVYKNEVHKPLSPGQQLKGYIKPIREDGKIDVSLTPIGYQSIEPNAQKILDKLESNDGFLPYTDNSNPDLIREAFGISKKLFKKSVGALYKQKRIVLKEDGIYKA
jgi:predicted RNA-binding protein (virulence factor B family)